MVKFKTPLATFVPADVLYGVAEIYQR